MNAIVSSTFAPAVFTGYPSEVGESDQRERPGVPAFRDMADQFVHTALRCAVEPGEELVRHEDQP